jgi:hypothetical protein
MTKPAVTFRDPQSCAKLDCDGLLAAAATPGPVPAFLDGLTIGTELPDAAPQGPLLVVRSGLWDTYQGPITATNRIRIVAWHLDPDAAWDIASWFHGRLLAYRGDQDVVGYRYDSGPARDKDPDYGTPIAGFTTLVRMRPAIL